MKTCTRCGIEKQFSEFNKNTKNVDRLHVWCRECTQEYNRNRKKSLPQCSVDNCAEKVAAGDICAKHYSRLRTYGSFDLPKKKKERPCQWPSCHALAVTKRHCEHHRNLFERAQRHGLAPEDLIALVIKQENKCLLCSVDFNELVNAKNTTGFCIDHDHSCCPKLRGCPECIRGLLCDDCNQMLGKAKEDADVLSRAAMYLNGSLQ